MERIQKQALRMVFDHKETFIQKANTVLQYVLIHLIKKASGHE